MWFCFDILVSKEFCPILSAPIVIFLLNHPWYILMNLFSSTSNHKVVYKVVVLIHNILSLLDRRVIAPELPPHTDGVAPLVARSATDTLTTVMRCKKGGFILFFLWSEPGVCAWMSRWGEVGEEGPRRWGVVVLPYCREAASLSFQRVRLSSELVSERKDHQYKCSGGHTHTSCHAQPLYTPPQAPGGWMRVL